MAEVKQIQYEVEGGEKTALILTKQQAESIKSACTRNGVSAVFVLQKEQNKKFAMQIFKTEGQATHAMERHDFPFRFKVEKTKINAVLASFNGAQKGGR